MLVLTRKINEEIVIQTPSGEEITILLASHSHGKTRIGITAPSSYIVHRKEIWDDIKKNGPRKAVNQ